MGRAHTLRTRMLAGASVLAIAIAISIGAAMVSETLPAAAQGYEAEQVYRQEALAHARAIAEAWRRLEDHILRRSAAATVWTGSVPPAETGWLDAWTTRGVRARYCEDTLLVYMEPAVLKGVGRDQRSVQVAPHLYTEGNLAALHWLEGGGASGAATGTAGRASLSLPACLSDTSFGGSLPSGRAALAGVVRDPHLQRRERVSHERTVEDCPAGSHGDGRTLTREAVQAHDGRGDAVGDPEFGPWEVLIDDCRADYTEWEHYTLDCSWFAGPPHNREMTGREIWRREKAVTADGIEWGAPEFVSTSCWEGRTPPLPQAEISETVRTETTTGVCPAGYSGTRVLTRTVTERSTRWPWDAAPIMQDIPGNWIANDAGCSRVVTPGGPPGGGTPGGGTPGGGTPGGGTPGGGSSGAGSGGPDGGQCSPPSPPSAPGEGTCSGPGVGPGGAGAGGGAGGCFLTEAVVGQRGMEADDGPTLTALRAFRDGYMQATGARQELVRRYYEIAPRIVVAIPDEHADWAWISERVNAAVAAIAAGADDRAFGIYVDMVERLSERWLEPAAGAAS